MIFHPGAPSLALGGCLCLLYLGYEYARGATISLFTRQTDDGLLGASTALNGFILSAFSLAVYGRGIEVLGPMATLVVSAVVCAGVFVLCALGLRLSDGSYWAAAVVSCTFAFRESYVTLISAQIYSLLGAELKRRGKKTSRRWFCIIQGVSCVCSALAGLVTGSMATAGGEVYLLLATAASLLAISGTMSIAMFYTTGGSGCRGSGGCSILDIKSETDEDMKLATKNREMKGTANGSGSVRRRVVVAAKDESSVGLGVGGERHDDDKDEKMGRRHMDGGLWRVLRLSVALFRRSPLLRALLAEAVVCQVLTAILNMSFNEAVRQSRAAGSSTGSDARAAGFVGKSFAFIGLLSGALQLVVMPWAMILLDPLFLLGTVPIVGGLGFCVSLFFPGFRTATAAFAITKILDYSVRGTALELVYQSLGEDERLLGKEAIATVGVRIGRTTAHVALSLCVQTGRGAATQRVLMILALFAGGLWAWALRWVELLGGTKRVVVRGGVSNGVHGHCVGGAGGEDERLVHGIAADNSREGNGVRKGMSSKANEAIAFGKGRKEL